MGSTNLESNPIYNKPAKGISYYTPEQTTPAGTFLRWKSDSKQNDAPPKIFTPIKIRSLTLQNRIWLSPLCQYSAQDGSLTAWHMAHLGGIVSRGPGLICIEATAVQDHGRITPQDSGIWKDSQIESHAKVVEFVHSQNQHAIIQLAHAGRKASTVAPWLSRGATATVELEGWPDDVSAPSAVKFADAYPSPKALTLEQISELKTAFVEAAKRAVKAGYDGMELHMAHGYLLHEFASPASNLRTDQYGGSFENRTRLHIELVDAVRAVIPDTMPLFVRISASDHLESNEDKDLAAKSWKLEDTIKLAQLVADHGVDVIDISSGGNHSAQKVGYGVAYQADFAFAVKKAVGDKVLVSTVGGISSGKVAEDTIEKGNLDLICVGRAFQKNPGLVFAMADELDVDVKMPSQIQWAFGMPKK